MTEQPYAPQGTEDIGKAPVDGEGGERGTSAFAGNAAYDESGRSLSDTPPDGPATGAWYYSQQSPTPITTGIQESSREPAAVVEEEP